VFTLREDFVRVFAVLLIVTFLFGCASHKRMYAGPKQPPENVATIKGIGISGPAGYGFLNFQIRKVNGVDVKPGNMMANSVDILPGENKLRIGLYNLNWYSEAEFKLDAKAGTIYTIQYDFEGKNFEDEFDLKDVWLVNEITKEKVLEITCWGAQSSSVNCG